MKLLTRDTLRRRGMHIQLNCVLCRNCPVESVLHLLYLCPYSVTVWFEVTKIIDTPIMTPAMTGRLVWENLWQIVKRKGVLSYKQWLVCFICVAWMIWKQRNNIVFNEQRIPPSLLARRCAQEMSSYGNNIAEVI